MKPVVSAAGCPHRSVHSCIDSEEVMKLKHYPTHTTTHSDIQTPSHMSEKVSSSKLKYLRYPWKHFFGHIFFFIIKVRKNTWQGMLVWETNQWDTTNQWCDPKVELLLPLCHVIFSSSNSNFLKIRWLDLLKTHEEQHPVSLVCLALKRLHL